MPTEGATATNPATGERAVYQGGQWHRMDQGKLTEDQGKSQGYARLMSNAEQRYAKALAQGYDPGSPMNTLASIAEGLPFGGLDGLGAALRGDTGDLGRQAELQWSDAQLKAMSGAASPEAEVKRNVRTFFPRPGESLEKIKGEKQDARRTAFDAARRRSGPAGAEIKAPASAKGPKRLRFNPKTGLLEQANGH